MGTLGAETWLSATEALDLFDHVQPSQNVSESDRKHWINTVLQQANRITEATKELVTERAAVLRESHEKLHRAIMGHRVSVEPFLPPDILAVAVALPVPNR